MKESIFDAILQMVENYGSIDANALAEKYQVSRQTIHKYIGILKDRNLITNEGKNKYNLIYNCSDFEFENRNLQEDLIREQFINPLLPEMTKNAKVAFAHCFLEMFNNAIEHSQGTKIKVKIITSVYDTQVWIMDNGIGIFEKISRALKLTDKRFAVLELAKGKFTTEPDSHTGEGIFFSSKIADRFVIFSDGIEFVGNFDNKFEQPVLFETKPEESVWKTIIYFKILNKHEASTNSIFEKFTQQPEDYGFSKTTVPVKLLGYGDTDALFISRSQARRLMARLEKFEDIIMDFDGIKEIGQAFADEVFRVFLKEHPHIKLRVMNCNEDVLKMIRHVQQ